MLSTPRRSDNRPLESPPSPSPIQLRLTRRRRRLHRRRFLNNDGVQTALDLSPFSDGDEEGQDRDHQVISLPFKLCFCSFSKMNQNQNRKENPKKKKEKRKKPVSLSKITFFFIDFLFLIQYAPPLFF